MLSLDIPCQRSRCDSKHNAMFIGLYEPLHYCVRCARKISEAGDRPVIRSMTVDEIEAILKHRAELLNNPTIALDEQTRLEYITLYNDKDNLIGKLAKHE